MLVIKVLVQKMRIMKVNIKVKIKLIVFECVRKIGKIIFIIV